MKNNYFYQAVDGEGNIIQGNLISDSKKNAAESLMQRGLFVVKLKDNYLKYLQNIFNLDIDKKDLIMVCHQISVMIKAGVPLGEAIHLINRSRNKRKDNNDRLSIALREIYISLQGGSNFSGALSKVEEGVFPRHMIAAIAAGETGGILDEILERETRSIQREYQIKLKFKNVMIYPSFLIMSAILLLCLMFTMVLPVFIDLFNSMNVRLPFTTLLLINSYELFTSYYSLMVGLVVAFILIFYNAWQYNKYRIYIYAQILKLPLLGKLISRLDLQCWIETLGMLLASGVIITDAVNISSEVISNEYLRLKIKSFSTRIKRGEPLSQIIALLDCADDFIIELIRTGEISGDLPAMLSEAALLCNIETESLIKKLEAMVEPIVILLIGSITGFLVISILMPIMEMMTIYS